MQADKTTLNDLSIFQSEEELSVFHHLNHTQTNGGREYLRYLLGRPLSSVSAIQDTQHSIRQLIAVIDQWPVTVTNGTMMVIDKFYESQINTYPSHPNAFNSAVYKLLNGPDFSLTRYTVTHTVDFVKGMQQVVTLLQQEPASKLIQEQSIRIETLLARPLIQEMLHSKKDELKPQDILRFGVYLRNHYKQQAMELMDIYSRLDAYLSLAIACRKHHYIFPEIEQAAQPYVNARALYHPLLTVPVAYDVTLDPAKNFLFLTGANMAGKSTFIKAVGLGVYLAHIGMAVPATSMRLSLFDGLLSNIQVVDNIVKGESYFFNEVQRIRSTIEKISDGRNWLILIDELFKGTNVQDAMKCSTVVIEGLHKMKNALFVLSTHLYEIGEGLRQYPNISFRYFETSVAEDQLVFSYQLKEGISNDRLGYLILKREGVVDMLEKL